MEDLLPILLFILFSVIGVLGKSKKKPKRGLNKPQGNKIILEDILKELNDKKEFVVEQEDVEFADFSVENEDVEYSAKLDDNNYHFKPKEEGTSTIKEKIAQYKAKNETKPETLTKKKKRRTVIKKRNDFNLKKAVVYSEIINRKYV